MTATPPAQRPEFPQTLTEITGLTEQDGVFSLFDSTSKPDKFVFLNSGIGLSHSRPTLQTAGLFASNYFRQGKNHTFSTNYLDPDKPELPHFHPGGEWALVEKGSYFDADMTGNVLRMYHQGSKVFYPRGSTHRPLTHTGAYVTYETYDGIVLGQNAEDLLTKMKGTPKTDELALEFALLWMVSDPQERESLRSLLEL